MFSTEIERVLIVFAITILPKTFLQKRDFKEVNN